MKINEMNKEDFKKRVNGRKYEELTKYEQLEYAKFAVIDCLENCHCLIDWKDISFWGKEVQRLRDEIRDDL